MGPEGGESMPRPRIAIPREDHAVDRYRAALERAGATVIEWDVRELAGADPASALSAVDGLLLPGGGDIDPALFGQRPHPMLGQVSAARDAVELPLARQAMSGGLPVLGICRGIQVLAVAAGGSLWQDIPSAFPDADPHIRREADGTIDRRALLHQVRAEGLLAEIHGRTGCRVNSVHHQAVSDPGDLIATAWSGDGLVEGIEGRGEGFVLGVQWHPEELWEGDPLYLGPFVALVEAARPATRP